MAKQCINCGKKIFFISVVPEIMIGDKSYEVCENCFNYIHREMMIIKNSTAEEYDEVKSTFEEKCKNKEYSDIVANYIRKKAFTERDKRLKREEIAKNMDYLIATCKLTTGYNFEGYKIDEYFGIVSGEAVLGTGFLSELSSSVTDAFGMKSGAFGDKMRKAKQYAIDELITETAKTGGNAIIGVSFQIVVFSNNSIGVSANGTSVKISKTE